MKKLKPKEKDDEAKVARKILHKQKRRQLRVNKAKPYRRRANGGAIIELSNSGAIELDVSFP